MIEESRNDKDLFHMTLGDLKEVIKEAVAERDIQKSIEQPNEGYVYGIAGIAKLFGISMSTAQRLKASGKLDPAISQTGHIIVVDKKMALELMRPKKIKQ